jgi:transposase
MPRHRSHSVAFKRQVAEEYLAGETLHGLIVPANQKRRWPEHEPSDGLSEGDGLSDRHYAALARSCVLR